MNFWNMSVIGLTCFAPLAALLFLALRGERAPGIENRALLALFVLAMVAAAAGVAHYDRAVKLEFLWPFTLEQSGYFEFSIQLLWSRFVWIFFSAALLLGFSVYDLPPTAGGSSRAPRLFLTGSFFFSVLAFLSENTLLSLMFIEIAAFLLHAFGMQAGGDEGERERASYFKRACFIFLGLIAMFGVALSRELSTNSVVLLGAVLYILSLVVSKHNPTRWSQLPLLFVHIGMALFLLERVLTEEAPPELAAPLAVIFGVGTVLFAAFSLLSPASLGAAFWLIFSFLGYLLYLRFSSGRPADPFWGAFEAIGLGAGYALTTIFRFGDKLDQFGKRAFGFVLLALLLGLVSGALPSVEITAARFDSETSLARVVVLGLLTFLVSAVSSKALAVSFAQPAEKEAPRSWLACLAPAFVMLLAQIGVLVRWNDLTLESLASGGFSHLLYDPRVLLTGTAAGAGILAGGLLGTNSRFAQWAAARAWRMEDFFPSIDPAILQWNLRLAALPERGMQWVSNRAAGIGGAAASFLDNLDRGVFGDRFFRRLSEYGISLSLFARFFHSGQARAYLFLGVLITLLSSLVFLMEGR